MSVTLYVSKDDRWDNLISRIEGPDVYDGVIEVTALTAERWESAIAAYVEVQREISASLLAATTEMFDEKAASGVAHPEIIFK